MSSSSTLEEVTRRPVRYHRPHTIDWRERFGLAAENPPDFGNVAVQKNRGLGIKDSSKYFCFKCKKSISENVAKFCFQNRPKFGGKTYCYERQKSFRKLSLKPQHGFQVFLKIFPITHFFYEESLESGESQLASLLDWEINS
jgi:hypothetical protein